VATLRPLLSSAAVTLPPWEYLFVSFNPGEIRGVPVPGFPDLYNPLWIAAAAVLVLQVIIYNVRTRQLRRFEPLVTMQEWLLWTGVITMFMILVEAVFNWYFLFVVLTVGLGLAAYVWVRFIRFPPLIAAYNERLRRARFFSEARYRHPEATIRTGRSKRSRRRRR
jgi:hypothetical protein